MEMELPPVRERPAGPPLARGNTADVYPWDDGHVLKLFHRFSLESARYEQQIARQVHASGLPVPAAGPILRVDGRYGLLYERVDGSNMLQSLQRRPWRVIRCARRLATLHAAMHQTRFQTQMPAMRARLERKIQLAEGLPAPVKEAMLAELAVMPDGDRMCHGDFHPMSVLLTAGGEVVIDWIDATSGNPLADVARTSIILLGAAGTAQVPSLFLNAFIRLFHAIYLQHYFRLRPGGQQEYRRWLPIVAAGRLSEQIPELKGWLVAQARQILPR